MKYFLKLIINFTVGYLVVSLYFLPIHQVDDGIFDLAWFLPLALIPLVGLVVWVESLKGQRRVPSPPILWACLALFPVGVSLYLSNWDILPLRRALMTVIPFLMVPILFQKMVQSRDRRSLRLILQALLVLTLYEVALQYLVVLPNLEALLKNNLESLLNTYQIDSEDMYAVSDLRARIKGGDLYGHFIHANHLSMALLILSIFSLALKRYLIFSITFLLLIKIGSLGVICASLFSFFLIIFPLIGRKYLIQKVLVLGCGVSYFLSQPEMVHLINQLSPYRELDSISFRLSYWQTARQMSEIFGAVGLGQYDRFAEMARFPGGHYSNAPHNGFLKLVAEIGLFSSIAAMIWFSYLFRGKIRLQDTATRPRRTMIWGAVFAVALSIFSSSSQFHFGHTEVNGQIVQKYPHLDWVMKCVGMVLFVSTLLFFSRLKVRIFPGAYLFATLVFLFHFFVDSYINFPGVLILVFLLASLGWEKFMRPIQITWHLFPVACALAVFGLFHIQHFKNRGSMNDPYFIQKIFYEDPSLAHRTELRDLLVKWHEKDPADVYPLWQLMVTSSGQEMRVWMKKCSLARPSDPSHQLRIANWLWQKGQSKDTIRPFLNKIDYLNKLDTLPRYRLSEKERVWFDKLVQEISD